MSEMHIPQFTQGDRMAKARDAAGISVQRMAELLGVSRTTISNYEHGRTEPNRAVLLGYAAETGVPVWWLEGTDGEPLVTQRKSAIGLPQTLDASRLVAA